MRSNAALKQPPVEQRHRPLPPLADRRLTDRGPTSAIIMRRHRLLDLVRDYLRRTMPDTQIDSIDFVGLDVMAVVTEPPLEESGG